MPPDTFGGPIRTPIMLQKKAAKVDDPMLFGSGAVGDLHAIGLFQRCRHDAISIAHQRPALCAIFRLIEWMHAHHLLWPEPNIWPISGQPMLYWLFFCSCPLAVLVLALSRACSR
jgi:hypothetical protein